jgi:hypothetical protein
MFTKLSFFVIPFAFWIAYVLGLIALTELLIARKSQNRSEKRIMQTLAASFIGVGVVIFARSLWTRRRDSRRTLSEDDRESRIACCRRAAGVLHLSLPLSRNHHRREPDRGDVSPRSCLTGLRLRYPHDRRLDERSATAFARA